MKGPQPFHQQSAGGVYVAGARNKDRIRLPAYVRFLQLIGVTDLKDNELAAARIRHTQAHIDELLKTVDSLILE